MISNQKELYTLINTLLKVQNFAILKKGVWFKKIDNEFIVFEIGKKIYSG
jgi:hypothetical protein